MRKKTAVLSLAAAMMIALLPVSAQAAWKSTSNGMMYTTNSGYYTGWKEIDGKAYYFGNDGIMRKGWQKISIGGGTYTYYFGEDGVRRQGFATIKDSQGKALRYYFTKDRGRMLTGFQTIDNRRYYFNENGVMQLGWLKFNGYTMYADPGTGELYANKWLYTVYNADETRRQGYYFDENGKMVTSRWLNGCWFPANGLFTGAVDKSGLVKENGKTYYYNGNGSRTKYTGFLNLSGKRYYFAPEMKNKGWFKVGGVGYYATKSGPLYTNKWIGKRYVKDDGAMVTGWYTIGSSTYYFDAKGLRVTGWKKISGKNYYFSTKGILQRNAWVKVGKKGYRTGADGEMVYGLQKIGENYYFMSVKNGVRLHGWIKSGNLYYYAAGKNFVLYRNKMFKVKGKYYYAKGDCSLATGLMAVGNKLYFFNSKRQRVSSTLQTVGGASYYFGKDGAAVMNNWQQIGKNYYYFGGDGVMVKGGTAGGYHIGADGKRGAKVDTSNGWKTISCKKYYFENGTVATGWRTISGSKYYFNADGSMMTGANYVSGKKYYFYPSGILAVGTKVAVGTSTGAKEFTIADSGVITAEKNIEVAGNSVGAQIAREGLKYIGNPYVWGGESLTNGADCSGFTLSIFAKFGIKLGHYTDWQLNGQYASKVPTKVANASALLPGDLIFYGDTKSGSTSHVGIYIGNNQIVHASNSQAYPAGGIKISDYRYNSNIVGMVRYW